jgi:hypothetical protein
MPKPSTLDSDSLYCSFCRKAQSQVSKLISSPSDYPRAYICDECIAVCASILEDDRGPADHGIPAEGPPDERHPLLDHPLASRFLASVEKWIRRQSLQEDAAEEFAQMRALALRMTDVHTK